jgi:hypothetical protein
MTQRADFSNGGYVVHKIAPPGVRCRASAWFDASGSLLDAELIDRRDRSRQVKRGGPVWRFISRIYGAKTP